MERCVYFLLMFFLFNFSGAQTIDECYRAAENNYPLIKRYDLINKTTDYTLSNIQKGWLPQINATAQATYQSDVTSWPDEMQNMLSQMGVDVKGLKKDQYRIGIDVVQSIYDGGSIRNQKSVATLQGEVEKAQNDIDLYLLRKRVNELYFSDLLIVEHLHLMENLLVYMKSNEEKIENLYHGGTASLSDYNTIKAERLSVEQQIISYQSQQETVEKMLELFCGIEITKLVKPDAPVLTNDNQRPELKYIDSQIRLIDARSKQLDSALLPRVSLFASGYYGYPGYNMFDDMIHHDWSFNGIVGLKVTWNIGALYTRKSDLAKLQVQRQHAENLREVFLFNNEMEQEQRHGNIKRYSKILSADDDIIQLRSSVRKASESRLSHGIIDVSELVKDIKTEHDAFVQKSIHEIEILKELSELQIDLNGF